MCAFSSERGRIKEGCLAKMKLLDLFASKMAKMKGEWMSCQKRDNLIKAVWSWWWLVCLWRMGRTILNWIEVRQHRKPPKQMNFQKSSKQPLTPLSFSENHILQYNFTRSSGALRAPTSSLRPCGMNPECPRPRTPNPERPNPECPTVAGWGCELYWKYFQG